MVSPQDYIKIHVEGGYWQWAEGGGKREKKGMVNWCVCVREYGDSKNEDGLKLVWGSSLIIIFYLEKRDDEHVHCGILLCACGHGCGYARIPSCLLPWKILRGSLGWIAPAEIGTIRAIELALTALPGERTDVCRERAAPGGGNKEREQNKKEISEEENLALKEVSMQCEGL